MNAEDLELFDRCSRLSKWSRTHPRFALSPLRAIYHAIDAGLTAPEDGEKAAETYLIDLAGSPGLDIEVADVYSLAIHYSKLAATLVAYLRGNDKPWAKIITVPGWQSGCYEAGDAIRRIVLIDHWSDQRKMAEIRSWRTVAETSMLNRPMLINFISIGSSSDGRRVSPWSKALKHPKSKQMRFAKRGNKSDGFSESWIPVWREQFESDTKAWLGIMQSDGVFADLVHSIRVPVSPRREEYVRDIARIRVARASLEDNPPMSRSNCYGISPCKFVDTCHASTVIVPE